MRYESESTPSETERSEPALTRSERLFLRISIWQTVLSVAAVLTSVIALYAALTESEAVRRQTAASVWPYVQLAVNDHATAESASFELGVTNVGVGPAQVREMRVTIDGVARTSWEGALRTASGGQTGPFAQDFVTNRVISPGETVPVLSVQNPALVRALQAVVEDPDTAIEFCYCSIFDECWVADSRQPNASRATAPTCPGYGVDAFGS